MNGKKAKALRRMAREEMVGDPERKLVRGRQTGVVRNEPLSVRSMNLQLKKQYLKGPK